LNQAAVKLAERPSAVSRLPSWPVVIAAPALALSVVMPLGAQYLWALAAVIVLGVPHGALDGEAARALLRPRLGQAWFAVFSLPYLTLVALVLLSWRLAPVPTLAAFLIASVWHFGSEDAPGAPLEAAVRGGLPIALAVLAHPAATTAVFATIAATPLPQPPGWLWNASLLWLALAITWTGRTALRRWWRSLAVPALLAGVFVALPPLTAFAIYFVCVHAPTHTAALIRNRVRAPRVVDGRSAILLSLPLATLTLLIGAALWPFYDGMPPQRLLCLTFQGLAALTLPHMLLDMWLTRRERAFPSAANRPV
jgi:Brp/Blh family beta-carotene 15,15'-monooxygenase